MLLLITGITLASIAIFGVAQLLGVPLLTEPERYLTLGSPASTALACFLLVGDFVLPVPSSLLFAYLGAAHGFALGTVIASIAHVASGACAFLIGRLSQRAITRWIGEEERARVDGLLARWGIAGIAASRPVPVIAETVSLVAGMSAGMGWGRFLLATAAGSIPYAAINVAAGAEARQGSFGMAVAAAGVMAIALWAANRAWRKRH